MTQEKWISWDWCTVEKQSGEGDTSRCVLTVSNAVCCVSQYPKDYFIFHFVPSFLESGSPSAFLPQSSHGFLRNRHKLMRGQITVKKKVTILTTCRISTNPQSMLYINIISARPEPITIKCKHPKNYTSSILSCSATRLTVKGDLFIFLLHLFWVLILFNNCCDQSKLVCCASWTFPWKQQAHAPNERHTLNGVHFGVEKYDFRATGFLSGDIKVSGIVCI